MTELVLYNTASRRKEVFTPLDAQHVGMYVCGPTVYDLIHIGNARPAVVFDLLFRLLQDCYPRVTYARNITDIDDKIIAAAARAGEPIDQFTHRYAEEYRRDTQALGVLEPTLAPRATEHIAPMLAMIERLLQRDHAYVAAGHVLFAVQSMADYGALSGRSLADMLDGARVEVAPYKRYAGDFVLWKPSSAAEPGWDSPWGRGRPGWHLECSAMVQAHLGATIDIHGGGRDLIFPHHENERAQSCCAQDGREYVRYWLHNGHVNIDGEKMAKSQGNFRTVRDLCAQYPGEVIRFALLSAQYRSELDFSAALLEQSKASLDRLYGLLRPHAELPTDPVPAEKMQQQPVYRALLDDLNTPLAIGELHALCKSLGTAPVAERAARVAIIRQAGRLLGLLQQDPQQWFQQARAATDAGLDEAQIAALLAERQQARQAKDFARADAIRDQLQAQGVLLEDARSATSWKRA
ncbi:MAG: cysteine--tRNA ligase [Cellvibrionales bacterium]|nr:cysteine--tRNA ligase [Cellvibrionales bacterium]